MKGRYAAFWNSHVAEQPAGEMVRTLALGGFGGILIDRAWISAALRPNLLRNSGSGPWSASISGTASSI